MTTSDRLFIEKLNRFIDDNLDNHTFTIDTMCQSLGISRSQLHRIVKEQTDFSTSLYIRKRRLLRARNLLTATDLRICEISDLVGVNNAQNLSTYFTDEFGISPTEFRKLQGVSRVLAAVEPASATLTEPLPDELALPDPETLSAPALMPQPWHRRWGLYAGLAAGLLLILAVGLYSWQRAGFGKRTAPPVSNSLAILPFTNLGNADSNPACECIMDDVHRSVSFIKNLKVISRTSSDSTLTLRRVSGR